MDSNGKRTGISIPGWLLGALAIWAIGFIWYGWVFGRMWASSHGVTDASYEGQNPMIWMFTAGLLIPLVLSWGIGWFRSHMTVSGMGGALKLGAGLAALIMVPTLAYNLTYLPVHNWTAFIIDSSHALVSMMAASAIHAYFGKA